MSDELTEVETRLVVAARRGEELVCGDLSPEQLRTSTDAAHVIRAELLRELLLGHHGEVDPRGVRIRAARVTGTLDLSYVDTTIGLHLTSCVCAEPVVLNAAHLPRLHFGGSHIPALRADGLRVDGGMFLNKEFTVDADTVDSAVRLVGAHIGGGLSLSGARITNKAGPALIGDRLQVDGSLFLNERFTAAGHSKLGAVRLLGAHIGGQLNLSGAQLTNNAGPALAADRLQVDGDLFLDNGFTAKADTADGAVRLLGAHIGGQLSFSSAQLTNNSGAALAADRLQVDADLFLDNGFTATADTADGAIRLFGAHIVGQFSLSGAQLTNEAGSALAGNGLAVDGDLLLNRQFIATGRGELGAVRLLGAHIGGALNLTGAQLANDQGLVLDLEDARARSVLLSASVVCPSGAPTTGECVASTLKIDVGGLEYTSVIGVSWEQWLHILRRHTIHYMPMPYQQLAGRQKAAGHDRDARRTLIAQQQDLHVRGQLGGRFSIAVHWLWGALAGYGYRAGRTAIALLVVLALAGGLGWWAGHTVIGPGRHVAQHTNSAAEPGTACSGLEQIGLGIDRGLPLGSTGIRTYCDLNTATPVGEWFTFAIWVLQALVWALATLAVAGYTGLIRKIT